MAMSRSLNLLIGKVISFSLGSDIIMLIVDEGIKLEGGGGVFVSLMGTHW